MTTDDELIACIQAKKAGKVVQFQSRYTTKADVWFDLSGEHAWGIADYCYRIKPQPVKPMLAWINTFSNASLAAYPTEALARCASAASAMGAVDRTATRFIELTPKVHALLAAEGVEC